MASRFPDESERSSLLVGGVTNRGDYGIGHSTPINYNEDDDMESLESDSDDGRFITRSVEAALNHPVETQILDVKYQSLDYDQCENELYQEEEKNKGRWVIRFRDFARWAVNFWIGTFTALIACFIDFAIINMSDIKNSILKSLIDASMLSGSVMMVPFLFWAGWDVSFVLLAALLTCWEPVAAGSGIPQIKCYLNGVLVPRVVRIKTLFVKVVGVISSVVGGLAIGKEGPMIHSGAVVAAGISQGRSSSFNRYNINCKSFTWFRTDQEKRDFVAAGAAAGVAAAFGAPLGGVLFSLEEGASFWNQGQTWRTFFASTISFFVLNITLSFMNGHPMDFSYSGLLNFGKFEDLDYSAFELLAFIAMGVLGGLLGALFNGINGRLTIYRKRYLLRKWKLVAEACMVGLVTTTVAMFCTYYIMDCQPLGKDPTDVPVQLFCPDGQASSMAAIWMQTPEASVRSLFHDQSGTHSNMTLAIFATAYFLLATWTYGLALPSGLFIPSLLTGAAWGRLIAQLMLTAFPQATWIQPGKFALVGAAAQLGGVVRMTLSLTVILIEATGNILFGLPLMLVLMVAKWVGDLINEGLYDIHIEMAGVPILHWEPPPVSSFIHAKQVMSHPVITLKQVEKVGHAVDILRQEKHQGFPVVSNDSKDDDNGNGYDRTEQTFGTLTGLITRDQLIILLQRRVFLDSDATHSKPLCQDDFRATYPRYTGIENITFSDEERDMDLDLSRYMNPAPYAVSDKTSLPRIFKLFRGLGLRHLMVINRHNEVIGLVTRKDLARYRYSSKGTQEVVGFVHRA